MKNKCKVCNKNFQPLYRCDNRGWYTVCPLCGDKEYLKEAESANTRITMAFVNQPYTSPNKYDMEKPDMEQLYKIEFVSVNFFDTPEQFMTSWYMMANNFPGAAIKRSFWYVVYDGSECIRSADCSPSDERFFLQHFGEELAGWTRPAMPDKTKICVELMQKADKSVIDAIYDILTKHNVDADGVCPVCGGNLEFGCSELVDCGNVYSWECPDCGCTGHQWEQSMFPCHCDVTTKDGKVVFQ